MYEEEYAAHEASLADRGYVYASGIRWLDMTASMLNKELDGFPTAKQRVKFIQTLKEQAEEARRDLSSKITSILKMKMACQAIEEHGEWQGQLKKWEEEKEEILFDERESRSEASDSFMELKANYELWKELAKQTAQEIREEYKTFHYFNGYAAWDNTEQFDIIRKQIQEQILLFSRNEKHWKPYADVESEAPMQLQPSTPVQTSVQKITLAEGITAADIERIFTAMQQAGIITTNVTGERIAQMFFAEKPQSLTNSYDKAKSVRNGEAQDSKNSERLRGFAQIILRDLKPK